MMLSSMDRDATSIQCRELGIATYLVKPVRQAELWKAVTKALGYKESPNVPRRVKSGKKEDAMQTGIVGSGPALKVLLAEDNAINAKVARTLLEKKGHTVVLAQDGEAVLELHGRETFDLILMDVQMPEMDGYEATRLIREDEKKTGRRIPILAMTAHAMKGDRERCIDAGMDGYVSKPVRAEELYESIRSVITGNTKSENPSTGEIPLNLSRALEGVDGDKSLLKSVADECAAEFPEKLREIGAFIRQNDAEQIMRKVHGLKSNIGLLGAERAYSVADALEVMASQSDLHAAGDAFSKLETEVHRVQNFLLNPRWMELCESCGFAN
jgi:two-component system sensor histidine kinase/response regulator